MSAPRTLGVVGTLVWDRLIGPGRDAATPPPVEAWGGVAYALAAAAASLPGAWSVRPIVKVGADLAAEALAFLRGLPRLDLSAVEVVPEPNNRVEIRYETATRRRERLSGGVPGWTWPELAPRVAGCDALLVNHISGFEMDLATARALADRYGGPLYVDLHSLFLGVDAHGHRVPRPLDAWSAWMRCGHVIQMNEDELALLGGAPDPWSRAEAALGARPALVLVTRGARGAAYAAAPGFQADPATWPGAPERAGSGIRRGAVAAGAEPGEGDPTGCGDVWGATTFARLLAGDALEEAMAHANRLAGVKVEHRGADGLHERLVQAGSAAGAASGGRA